MSLSKRKKYLTVPRLDQISFLVHGFGTKYWHEKDLKNKPEWRDFKFFSLDQKHSDTIRIIDKFPPEALDGDAILTDRPGLFLVIKTADCLPVFIVDEVQKAIAVVHCGWRGTERKIIQKAVQGLVDSYGCIRFSLVVALGPSIGRDCYEVGEEVRKSFIEKNLSLKAFRKHPVHEGKYLLDLREANRSQLISLGVKKENIFSLDICTHCEKDLLSFRRDKKNAVRMLNFIGISF